MLKRLFLPTASALLVLSLLAGPLPAPVHGTASAPSTPDAATPHGTSLAFNENAGQFAPGARFFAPSGPAGSALWLAGDALWLTLTEAEAIPAILESTVPGRPARPRPQLRRGVHLRLSFVGANPHPRIEPFDRLDTVVSYFLGHDPAAWRVAVPVWGGVRYRDLYPGIDLELSGAGGQYSHRLVVHPGADLGRVRLRVEGAQSLGLRDGRLEIQTAAGPFFLPLFQLEGSVPAGTRGLVHPRVEGLDVVSPLLLDAPSSSAMAPESLVDLRYSSYLGWSDVVYGAALDTDNTSSLYVAGYTVPLTFPSRAGACQDSIAGDQEIFVVKLNPEGTDLTYATFLGGTSDDAAEDLVVDTMGNAYLTGDTQSANFPTTEGVWDRQFDGFSDAFVVKLNPAGTDLVYSTLLGGTKDDDLGPFSEGGLALTVDGSDRAHVAGWTNADNFPVTAGVLQERFGGSKIGGDAFLSKLSADGSDLVYSTYLGGDTEDAIESIALGEGGAVYATGHTTSADFPTTSGAYQTEGGGEHDDAFVAKVNGDATGLVYSTFVGGSLGDGASAIAMDSEGSAYVSGRTGSPDFPTTAGAYATDLNGSGDAFVFKLNPSGSNLVYSTYLGGSDVEGGGYAIDVDEWGNATVGGSTASADFPTTPMALSTSRIGLNDAFVTQLNPDGTDLTYSTFLGGRISEAVTDLFRSGDLLANLTGFTYSENFPTTPSAYQRTFGGWQDAFVARIRLISYPTVFLPLISRNH